MSLMPWAHLLIVLYVAGATIIASAGRDLGPPGLRYWLRTGLPVRASIAGTSRKASAARVATTWTAQPCSWASLTSWPTSEAEGLHVHDLRRTGNTFAASGGAGIKDLMARMGHDSERAAMIYQHEARGADQTITSAIDRHVQAEQRGDDDDGAAGALVPVG